MNVWVLFLSLLGLKLGFFDLFLPEVQPGINPFDVLKILIMPTMKENISRRCKTIDSFTITVVLHSSGTFVSGKMMISQENRDVINTFKCSTTSF